MASNSEANLSSDFDIDEVINWDEQNYSSKGIEFQLPQLGLPSDAKTSQNTVVTLPNLGSVVGTSQGAQNSNLFYSALFGVANNPPIVQNSKNHGYSSRQAMVPPNALSFPSENINIPPLATSNASLLQFAPSLVRQNSSLAGQHSFSSIQNVQNSENLINDDVSPFGDSDDLIEGPLDRIVDQIIERQISERITEPLSSSFDDDTPVIIFSNQQAKAPQLSRDVSPQNAPLRSVTSRNVTSSTVPSPNTTIRSSPSPNAPTLQVSSPGNPTPPNPSSRNLPAQNITTTKIIPPNISPPNVPSQNIPSPIQHNSSHSYSTIQGLSSQPSQHGVPSQSHSKFRLQSPVSVPSSMVNTLGQTTMICSPALKPVTNISLGQTELSTNSLFQSSSGQRNSQSYPSFMLQNPNQTLIRRPSTTSFSSSLEDLLRMQKTIIRTSSPNPEQTGFTNQLARSSPDFSSVLTNKIGSEQSHSNVPSLLTTNIGNESSTALFPDVTDTTSNLHLKISTVSSPTAVGMNLGGQNINTSMSQYNRTSDSKSVFIQSQSSIPLNVTYPGQVVSNFSGTTIVSSPLTGNDEVQITSTVQTIQNSTTQSLASPRPNQQTSVNQFFVQSSLAQSTADINRNGNVFSCNTSSPPQNVVVSDISNVTQVRPERQQCKSVFTLIPSNTSVSQANSPTQVTPPVLFQNQANTVNSKPAGITTIKITSPSLNSAGFKYPTVGFIPNPAPKAVSIQPPRTTTIRLKSPTTTTFPTFRLTQTSLATGGNTPSTKPMVFTLAPGAQASLKGLPTNLKDKLTGRQVIFLQQPSGQPINTPKPQPMKIVFVDDSSIRQVVSAPVKSKLQPSAVVTQTPGVIVTSNIIPPSTENKPVAPTSTEAAQDSDTGSPSSADSDCVAIAAQRETEVLKRKESENNDGTEQKGRKKRRKDPNRPVKPLSSFQRFFQATQPTIRQQNPQVTFAEVSKTIKEMWENLPSKNKKVYQDAWRMERVQYKKAMEDYNAGLSEIDSVDSPSAKQAKYIEIKDDDSTADQIPVSPVDIPKPPENPAIISSSTSPASVVVSSSMPPPRTGKPLAMMAEMANKTKLASAHAAKVTGMTKSLHLGKNKASNGVEDVVKKKAKINPIPKKLCIRTQCNKPAKTTKERGTMFCSNDCLMRYCRGIFRSWVEARRPTVAT